jgi:hypothetical protein
METETLEQRLTAVEEELATLKRHLVEKPPPAGWEKVFGSFSDSEGFDEAVRLGREYRESLRPKDNEQTT